jgi:hypothetical protein
MTDESTNSMAERIFARLPSGERSRIGATIAVVTDKSLPTAVRPFMFGAKVVHELCFDTEKLWFFVKDEKIGAIVSAFVIASLSEKSKQQARRDFLFSDQSLIERRDLIIERAKRWNYGRQVSAFLERLVRIEKEWRQGIAARSATWTSNSS